MTLRKVRSYVIESREWLCAQRLRFKLGLCKLQRSASTSPFTMDPKTLPSDRGLAALPSELFRLIIQHLSEDRKTLRAISLACRMLQHEGQRQLYRKIRFLRRGPGTHIKFFKGILDNNRLALLVHEYSQDTFAHSQWGTLRDYLRRGLQAMVNLKVLQFLTVNDQPAADILRDCTFQLRSLVWWNSVDGHLSNFLLSQHSLQKLEVDWPEDKRDLIPRSFCPQLRVLCGDRGAMETFLPGREVISLHWMGPFVDDSAHRIRSVEHLLPCLSRIRFFSFGYPYTWSSFSSIIGLFPCVEVLELVFPDIDSHEVKGPSFSLWFDLIFDTTGIGAPSTSSLQEIADPCAFEVYTHNEIYTHTNRQVPTKHQHCIQEL